MTRFSSSFELPAKTKVKPLIMVSTRPVGATAELLFTLYILGTAKCWRSMNVKLNVSSSSLGKRMRKDGGPSRGAVDSGSYKQCLAMSGAWKHLKQYLDVLNDALVAKLALCAIPCRGKGIGRDVQEGAVPVVGDVEGSHRDFEAISY